MTDLIEAASCIYIHACVTREKAGLNDNQYYLDFYKCFIWN